MKHYLIFIVLGLLLFAGCAPQAPAVLMRVVVIADGRQRAFSYDQNVSVGQFLEQIGVELGPTDRVNPPEFSQIEDGLTITIVRVEEREECEQQPIPYDEETIPNEGLAPGERRLARSGIIGTEEVCYRITIENGQPGERQEIRRVTIQEPENEITFVGIDTSDLAVVDVDGTLAYISNSNAWLIRGSSSNKRPLTSDAMLDGRVFALSPEGSQLVFTQRYPDPDDEIYFNTLWALNDTRAIDAAPQQITVLNNVLDASWIPGQPDSISYSTGESTPASPGWQAFNDLWLLQLNPEDGTVLDIENLVAESTGGVYGWWGTRYSWSPDGAQLAWSRADGVGLVDLDAGTLRPILTFPVYQTFQDWVWQPSVSWSFDGSLIVTTVHGPPFGSEQPESSPIFDIVAADVTGTFQIDLVERSGIWGEPAFSPPYFTGERQRGYLAYLQARDPLNSVNGEYDLVVADRDGSNPRVLFPAQRSQPGITSPEYAWSPDGKQIALIYQGNLWVVNVETGRSAQLTLDGQASSPRWGP